MDLYEGMMAAEAMDAIQNGDIAALEQLLCRHRSLTTSRPDGERTLLHVATDWPGHFPNNVASVLTLIAHGADVNAPYAGRHSETPLHWAASSGDVDVLDALLDHGADIEATGAVIGGGTPLADAVAFGQWSAARRLVERGALANLWQAAALGLLSCVDKYFAVDCQPSEQEVTNAFWSACYGGQRTIAGNLLERGANLNWVGYDGLSPLDAASRSGAEDLVQWLRSLGAVSAEERQCNLLRRSDRANL